MGTRGKYGFYYKCKYYLFYNHFDSYPDGLGDKLLQQIKNLIYFLKQGGINFYEYIGNKIESAKIVTDDDVPSTEDLRVLEHSTNLQVSDRNTNNWYCLTRESHGNIIDHIDIQIFYCEVVTSVNTDVFIEYVYIIDIDNHKFYEINNSIYTINLDDLQNNLEKYPCVKCPHIADNDNEPKDNDENSTDEDEDDNEPKDNDEDITDEDEDDNEPTDNDEDSTDEDEDDNEPKDNDENSTDEDEDDNEPTDNDEDSTDEDEDDNEPKDDNLFENEFSLISKGWNFYVNKNINLIDFTKAYELTKKAVTLFGFSPLGYNNLGLLEMVINKNMSDAICNYLKSIDKKGFANKMTYVNLGEIFTYDKKIKELAIYYFTKSYEIENVENYMSISHLRFINEKTRLPESRSEFFEWLKNEHDPENIGEKYDTLAVIIEPEDIDKAMEYSQKNNDWDNLDKCIVC